MPLADPEHPHCSTSQGNGLQCISKAIRERHKKKQLDRIKRQEAVWFAWGSVQTVDILASGRGPGAHLAGVQGQGLADDAAPALLERLFHHLGAAPVKQRPKETRDIHGVVLHIQIPPAPQAVA